MTDLVLDAREWKTGDDFYDAFFKSVRAPLWHGRNFNALNDSIATGQINGIEVPYRIVIRDFMPVNDEIRKFVNDFANLIREIAARGCPVDIRFDSMENTCGDAPAMNK